jgi:YidC/Oxa1 family membrane protein insertase
MDKRFLLAIVLAAIVLVVTPWLFPPGPAARRASTTPRPDTVASARVQGTTAGPAAQAESPSQAATSEGALPGGARNDSTPGTAAKADTVLVDTPKALYRFTTIGAAPLSVTLHTHRQLGARKGVPVDLVRPGVPLLSYRLVTGRDTVPLDRLLFTVDSTAADARGAGGARALTFRTSTHGAQVALTYSFAPDSYLVRVQGDVRGVDTGRSYLLITLPRGLASAEADTLDDQHHLAYVVKPTRDDARSIPFGKLDTPEPRVESGPFTWVASKNKYFLVALLTPDKGTPFGGAVFVGAPHQAKTVTAADAAVVRPLAPDGRFAFELYTGPQEWRRLVALGRDLEHANPYGGIFQGLVQPFATIVMRVLLWMHDTLRLNYGWVLVIFGVAVRLILWPLNQSAMRSSLRMQRLQPELQVLQKKYKNNPEKQHTEMLRLYKEHGMSPLSPLMGCLPMLLPMPVLFALFFVFQNTIEFRGVSFLWLADISQKDPYYIVPVVMGISMYLLSWIGLRNSPPNPQAKMMAYVFPAMMTMFFLNLPSGLNLYYAVQNIAALPQQWLIAKERAKTGPPAGGPASSPASSSAAAVAARR